MASIAGVNERRDAYRDTTNATPIVLRNDAQAFEMTWDTVADTNLVTALDIIIPPDAPFSSYASFAGHRLSKTDDFKNTCHTQQYAVLDPEHSLRK